MDSIRSIAVIGAGGVGATIAYAALLQGVVDRVSLFDIEAREADAQALDPAHGLQFVSDAKVEGSNDLQICTGARVIVAAGWGLLQPRRSARQSLAGQQNSS